MVQSNVGVGRGGYACGYPDLPEKGTGYEGETFQVPLSGAEPGAEEDTDWWSTLSDSCPSVHLLFFTVFLSRPTVTTELVSAQQPHQRPHCGGKAGPAGGSPVFNVSLRRLRWSLHRSASVSRPC